MTSLDSLKKKVGKCENCALCRHRKNVVFGEGNPNADIVICGEAPGADEDESGRPFVGKAGQLLTKLLVAAGIERDDVFILNAVKCRPPDNRRPRPNEIQSCKPYLDEQLKLINPIIIIALGNAALEALTGFGTGITKRCGVLEYYQPEKGRDIPLYPCFHPSYLLRNPGFTDKSIDVIRQAKDFALMMKKAESINIANIIPKGMIFSETQ